MNKKFKLKEVHIRWIGIVIVAFLFSRSGHSEETGTPLWMFFNSLITTSIFWNGCVMIFFYFRRKFPLVSQTPKKLLYTILSLVVFLTISDPALDALLNYGHFIENFEIGEVINNFFINLFISAFIGLIYESVFFFDQWKKSIQLAEELKNQQIRTQMEVLQNQMSPHFLFNSLNTLSTLIVESQELAVDFTDNLSEVYRYILQNREKEVVSLEQEVEFVKSYIHLLQIRYPENLEVEIDISPEYLNYSIAPLTLQMLVENAIKHNIISHQMPLHIQIMVNERDFICVSNNLQKKRVLEKSTKTGLANIKKRYAFYDKKEVRVVETDNQFIVEVPLLQVVKNKEVVFS